jgi:gliding motility-associated protein GldE
LESIDPDPLQSLFLILLETDSTGLTGGTAAGIAATLAFLFLSALISAAESAFFSLSPDQVGQIRARGQKSDLRVIGLLESPKRLLASLLISNSFVNVALVIIFTYLTRGLFQGGDTPGWLSFLLQVLFIAAVILIAGEVMPRVYATRNPVPVARSLSGMMKILTGILYPFNSILVYSTQIIDKKMSRKSINGSLGEFTDTIELTGGSNTPEEEKKIIRGIAKFGDIEVKEIMKSRVDITSVDVAASLKDLLKIIIEAGYSRIPVYEGSFDQVKGILYIKDLLPYLGESNDFEWNKLLRDAFFVPENKKIKDLLQEFRERKIHMAVVVDEYGGTAGIVTLEDIIEEIVGEISDEHDEPVGEIDYSRIDEHNFIFEGKTSINDFCKILGINDDIFDEVKGEAESLAGLVLELLEKMPEKDEKVPFRNFLFTVKAVDKRRIRKIQVTMLQPPREEDD